MLIKSLLEKQDGRFEIEIYLDRMVRQFHQ